MKNQKLLVCFLILGFGLWVSQGFAAVINEIDSNFDGIDCDALLIHDYLKYVKFGYGRATDAACRDIRLGIIDRQEGVRLVRRYDGRVPFIARRRFINYLSLNDEE